MVCKEVDLSFLIGRAQKVELVGGCSDELSATSGVPHGSVLGPILFLPSINDLPYNIQSQIRFFADATTAYLSLGKQNEPQQLQHDLNTEICFRSGHNYGIWNSTQVSMLSCILPGQGIPSAVSTSCIIKYWLLLTLRDTSEWTFQVI